MFNENTSQLHAVWLLALGLSLVPALVPCVLRAQAVNPQEVSTQDVQPAVTFKTERNLVVVRAVVRDAKGKVVEGLHQKDFEILDRGKPQAIVSFSLEKPASHAPAPGQPAESPGSESKAEVRMPASTPTRFVALLFDDVNTPFEDLVRTRNAADHFLAQSVQPGDRVALFTSSGQGQVDFTSRLAQVRQALLELRARPIAPGGQGPGIITEQSLTTEMPAYIA